MKWLGLLTLKKIKQSGLTEHYPVVAVKQY